MTKKNEGVEHYFSEQPKSKMRLGLIRTYLRGKSFEFMTASGVFSPRQIDLGTRLLIECMALPQKGCFLDVGCGYGAVGIAAAIFNPCLSVTMVDVNTRAVWLARKNIELNRAENAEVRRGDLYEPAEGLKFDCIVSNPPVSAGMETVKAIITEAPTHMTCKARFDMVLRSKVAGKRLCMVFEDAFGNVEVLARESGYRVLTAEKQ
jgi:16S rRNA (guanine1207-N2)-methyltransferase